MSSQASRHPSLAANHDGRDFIVADLHGHRTRLDEALAQRSFDPERDRLLSVGDLVDRGPDNADCLALLDEPWFHVVRGNHEQMLIDAVEGQDSLAWSRWLMNGGNWALNMGEAELAGWAERLAALPHTLTLEHPEGRIGICHAQYRLAHWDDRFDAGPADFMDWIWGRSRLTARDSRPVAGVDWIFHGHTILRAVTCLGNSVFLDRGAYNGGPLVLVSVDDWLAGTDPYRPA